MAFLFSFEVLIKTEGVSIKSRVFFDYVYVSSWDHGPLGHRVRRLIKLSAHHLVPFVAKLVGVFIYLRQIVQFVLRPSKFQVHRTSWRLN
jgi:hypothetical protein